MGKYRILSMDGGNGLNTAELLIQLENVAHKHFLDKANVFAGTSAGGINALHLAASGDPTVALGEIKAFWSQVNASILEGLSSAEAQRSLQQSQAAASEALAQMPPPTGNSADLGTLIRIAAGLSMAALGVRSLFLNDAMKTLLLQRFGDMRLGDLTRYPVVVVTFQLDKQVASQSSDLRSWAPKLYTNLPYTVSLPHGGISPASNPDLDESVVDVAMRTSAAPLELPIYQSFYGTPGVSGFVDGGLVANNPSMITLAAIVGTIIHMRGGAIAPGSVLDEILVLSVGTGRNLVGTAQYLDPEFENGSAAWGYQKWLFDLSNPLVLVDAFLQGGNESAAFQCRVLLRENFNRLNVPIKDFLVPDDPRTHEAVQRSAKWLADSGWFWPGAPAADAISAPATVDPLQMQARRGAQLRGT
jgi:hypothetical protein